MAGKTQSFSFPSASVERLWQASVQAVGLLGYNVISSDKSSRQLSFNTGRSMWSFAGQDLTATLIAAGRGSQLVMGGSLGKGRGGSQVVSWGEKGRVIQKYADKVAELLPQIPEPKPAPAAKPRATVSTADELAKLAQLRASGVLTPAEFEAQKAKLLG